MAYESYADEIYYKNVYGGDAIADEFLNKALLNKHCGDIVEVELSNNKIFYKILKVI